MPMNAHSSTVAIIGGGFTGAAVALHLMRQLSQQGHDANWRIVVIESATCRWARWAAPWDVICGKRRRLACDEVFFGAD